MTLLTRRLLAAAGAALVSPAVAVAAAAPTTVKAHGSSSYNAFPGLARLPSGDLVAVWRTATIHEFQVNSTIDMAVSTDGGATWGTPSTIVAASGTLDHRDPALAYLDGLLVLSYTDTNNTTWTPKVVTSDDDGASWGSPVSVTHPYTGWGAFCCAPVVARGDGDWLLPYYGGNNATDYDSAVSVSDDQGATWTVLAEIADEAGTGHECSEPNIVLLGNGDLLCMIRSDTDWTIYKSVSSDGGATWSTPTAAITEASGRPAVAHVGVTVACMIRDRRTATVGGNINTGRYAVSTDGGATWPLHQRFSLTQPGWTGEFEYGQWVNLPGDELAAVYSLEDSTNTYASILCTATFVLADRWIGWNGYGYVASGDGSINLTEPGGTVEGDYVVVVCAKVRPSGVLVPVAAPAGWDELVQAYTGEQVSVFARLLDGTESWPYTFTTGDAEPFYLYAFVVAGTTDPFPFASAPYLGASSPYTATTAVSAGDVAAFVFVQNDDNDTYAGTSDPVWTLTDQRKTDAGGDMTVDAFLAHVLADDASSQVQRTSPGDSSGGVFVVVRERPVIASGAWADYDAAVLADRPAGYYLADHGTTGMVNRGVALNADGSISGSPSTVTGPGGFGTGLALVAASSQHLVVPSGNSAFRGLMPVLDTEDAAYEAWINYTDTLDASAAFRSFLCNAGGSAPAILFGSYTVNLTNEVCTILDSSTALTGWSGPSIPAGWHHHYWHYAAAVNAWTWYVDGVAVGTKISHSGGAGEMLNAVGGWHVGRRSTSYYDVGGVMRLAFYGVGATMGAAVAAAHYAARPT